MLKQEKGSSSPQRVLALVGPSPPPYGGMALQCLALRNHLSQENISAIIVSTNPGLYFGLATLKGIRTFLQTLIYLGRLFRIVPQASVVHILAASHFYFFARVAPAVLVARILGRRVILNYRGGEAFRFLAKYGWLARPVLRLANLI